MTTFLAVLPWLLVSLPTLGFLIMLWVALAGQPLETQAAHDHAIANETEVVWRRATAQAAYPTRPPIPCYISRTC